MNISVDFHSFPEESPKEGEMKLVLAWTSPLPMARHFWCFATFSDGKWTENGPAKADLTETVEYWFDLPSIRTLHDLTDDLKKQ